jgi:hypothetical protein
MGLMSAIYPDDHWKHCFWKTVTCVRDHDKRVVLQLIAAPAWVVMHEGETHAGLLKGQYPVFAIGHFKNREVCEALHLGSDFI